MKNGWRARWPTGRAAPPTLRSARASANVSREWRRNNPDKAHAQKAKARAANYHRPFVAIDSEGQNYPGGDIVYDGVRHPRHDIYLWGAAADDGRPPFWLMAAETRGLDKRPLERDRNLGLPAQPARSNSDRPIFTMFSGGYDITQILSTFPTRRHGRSKNARPTRTGTEKRWRIAHSPVLWKGYAISYVKGKSFDVWRLADPDKPYRGQEAAYRPPTSAIYDVFGFFQSSFSAVVKSMVDSGRATKEEADFIAAMKDRRDQFAERGYRKDQSLHDPGIAAPGADDGRSADRL